MITKPVARLAAIYVRTSSEHQAEKASPDEQEADCRKLATEQGLTVVAVYRDIEKYRVKRRLVEPSGTRADRPGLVAILNDAAAGQFDTILAWREDRLYRGMRAMLLVLETIQEHKINVLLARESFDARMAPIKAWVAQMELDGMKERMTMGVKARLRNGKANTGQDRYGYQRNGEIIDVVEEEAVWVRKVFEWYVDRVPIMEIRRRLVEADAPQKGSSTPRRIRWAKSSIQAILKAAREYADGIKIQRREGEAFEIPIPTIIDQITYQRFLEVRQSNNTHRARRVKHKYLLGGLLHCECNRKWQTRTASFTRKTCRGEKIDRKTLYGTYYCPQEHKEHVHPDCPRTIGSTKADTIVWDKICEVINTPEILLAGARKHVDELRSQAKSAIADNDRLQNELDSLTLERQWVITQARKGKISDEDMEYQLSSLSLQELNLKRELKSYTDILELTALDQWEVKANEYLEDLRAGLESLNAPPQTEEERNEVFEIKRKIVQTLISRVEIKKERKLSVTFRLNILALVSQSDDFCQTKKVETYTRTQASRSHPHPSEFFLSPSRPACQSRPHHPPSR